VFTSKEEVTAMRVSDGGELWWRTDGGRQGAALFGDEERVPGTGEAQISVECERERRKSARNNFTDGIFFGGGEETEAAARASVAALVGKGA
jgi:hypothetical protein